MSEQTQYESIESFSGRPLKRGPEVFHLRKMPDAKSRTLSLPSFMAGRRPPDVHWGMVRRGSVIQPSAQSFQPQLASISAVG